MKRIFCFLITFLHFALVQLLAQTTVNAVIRTFTFSETAYINKLSDNGRWAVASGVDANDNTLENYPYLLDITNNKSYSLLNEEEKLSSPDCGVRDITDDGTLVVGSWQGKPAIGMIGNDFNCTWTLLPLPEGLENAKGYVTAVTPDGSCMIGMVNNNSDDLLRYEEHPVMWRNGEVVEMLGMPKGRELSTGKEFEMNRPLDISADGNIIIGCLMFIYPEDIQHYVYNVAEQTSHIIGTDDFAATGSTVTSAVLSTNGEWVCGVTRFITQVEGSDYPDQQEVPYKYNVKEQTFTAYSDSQHHGVGATAVSDNGLLATASPISNPYRAAAFLIGDHYYNLDLILSERYGIDFVSTSGLDNTGLPISVSADGRTIAYIAVNEGNHVVILPESVEEAAKGVNLLAKNYVSPVTGSLFSTLRSITVTFDKTPVIVSPNAARLTEYGNQTVLRQSVSIAPTTDEADCKSFYVNFRPYQLQDGITYAVTIPAGTFRLEGSDCYNPDITTYYTGRKDEPVHVVAINLEDSMEVTSLSYNSPISMQFDTQLSLVDGAMGSLYQEGVSTPISDLTLATSSYMMAAYPATKRNLYKGVNYIVKIPAGSVTDLMGNCPNEEISYTYVGAYVPEPPADTLLFADDFSDPSASYNNFMLYEGDHLTPGSTAQGWTFDTDNTPWNFSIRDSEESSDYCAAAVSMYTTAGTADDWMVTNQIYLPNAYCYLAFDVQSYLGSKADRLKVYVYADDAIHTQLGEATVATIREKGVCIYDEQENNGGSDNALTGEWTHRRIPLANFAEKNVYIAFVNGNTAQSALFVDNVEVIYKSSCLLTLNTKTSFVAETEMEVKGVVKVIDENRTYNSIKVFFCNEEQTVSDTITATGLELKNGSVYQFSFLKKMPLALGEENIVTLGVTLGEDTKTADFTVKNLAFQTSRKVVIEELTGTWCSNCPDGIVAIEHLEEAIPGKVIPIAIHTQDIYAIDETYPKTLGLSAAPTARINRMDTIASPMALDKSTYTYSFVSVEGNQTFMDLVLAELETVPDANVKITSATYDRALNRMDFQAEVTYALNRAGVAANILLVVLEDNLSGVQNNGRANYSDPIYGDWGKNGIYGGKSSVQFLYRDVARALLGTSVSGTPGLIPATVVNGRANPVSLSYDLPTSVADMANTKVVCMLIDANTGRIINADLLKLTDANPESIASARTGEGICICGGKGTVSITTDAPSTVSLHRPDGSLISQDHIGIGTTTLNTGGYQGLIIVHTYADTHTVVKKVMIK